MIITTGTLRIRIDDDVKAWYSSMKTVDDEEFWSIEFEMKGGYTMSLDCKNEKHVQKILKQLDKLLDVQKL